MLSAYKNTAYVLLGGALCKAWQLVFSCFSLCALVKRCLCYNFTRFLFFAVYTIFILFFFCFPLIKNISRKPLCIKAFGFGGEQGIRTLETLLTFTRFRIVLLRPARTTLRICNQMLVYYIWPRRKNQVFFQKSWTFYFCTPRLSNKPVFAWNQYNM